MSQHAEIAAALGKKLWSTDLFIPQYRSGEIGEWRINPDGQLINDWGYYTGSNLVVMLPSLARRVRSDHGADQKILLPLLTPEDRDYPQMIEQVIRNRLKRRLVVDVEIAQPLSMKNEDNKSMESNG